MCVGGGGGGGGGGCRTVSIWRGPSLRGVCCSEWPLSEVPLYGVAYRCCAFHLKKKINGLID